MRMENEMRNKYFDFSKFEKIEDIIFLDEPILSHLIRNDKHFLLYLVDTLDSFDVLLLLEVEEISIFRYITGKLSLRHIIEGNTNICYLIEQDFNGEIINAEITQSDCIDKNYLPSDNSFLNYKPSENSYYYSFVIEQEKKAYLQFLREKAFYVKFEPNNTKYAHTIGFNQLANNLLSNLSASFRNFLKADFFEEFKNIVSDKDRLNRVYNSLLPDLDFRMVDLKYGSFEIGLSIDNTMKGSIEDVKMKNWASTVCEKYKDIVLDDKYDKVNVDRIISSYSEEDRRRIFNPLFKITENPDFDLQIKNHFDSSYKTIKIKDRSTREKIAPCVNGELGITDEKDYQIVNFTTVVDKNKSSKSINLDTTLFNSTNQTEVIIENKDFSEHGFNLDNKISISVKITTNKNLILLAADYDDIIFETSISSGKLNDGIRNITHKIYEYIMNKEI